MNDDSHERIQVQRAVMRTDTVTEHTSPPVSMSDDEVAAVHGQAAELVRAVQEARGGRQLAVLDEVASLGLQSQRNAGRQLELVKTRMSTLLDSGGAGKDVGKGLVDLRTALDRINPHVHQHGLWARTVGALPFVRHNALVRKLKKVALRYEPVSQQVVVIETKLREARSLLTRDNVELRRLYEDVEAQHEVIERQIFLGELLLEELEPVGRAAEHPLERERLQTAVHDVAIRIQDLRAMHEVHVQYFVSIELVRQNNSRLGQAVDRTLSMATNVVTIGLAIQAALARQRAVQEATVRTREFLGEVITQNADLIRRQTEEIGDLYNQPVIAMDKLVEAHEALLVALDNANHLRETGIQNALRNVDQLTALTRGLSEHVHGVETVEAAGHR